MTLLGAITSLCHPLTTLQDQHTVAGQRKLEAIITFFNLLYGNHDRYGHCFLALRHYIPNLDKISGMISASYSGGGVNYAAMSAKLEPSESINAATIVADNMMMAFYFFNTHWIGWYTYYSPHMGLTAY